MNLSEMLMDAYNADIYFDYETSCHDKEELEVWREKVEGHREEIRKVAEYLKGKGL